MTRPDASTSRLFAPQSALGFIVAGGRSVRMGRDKALLPYRQGTMLDHALEIASTVTSEVRILCGPSARYEDFGRPVVKDAVCGVGPLGGLFTALLAASIDGHERMFWLAVDLPLVAPDLLRHLVKELDSADVVMAKTSRGPEPLCAAFRTEPSLAAARRALLEGRLKLTSAVDGLLVRHVDADAAHLANVNTFGDYDNLARS